MATSFCRNAARVSRGTGARLAVERRGPEGYLLVYSGAKLPEPPTIKFGFKSFSRSV